MTRGPGRPRVKRPVMFEAAMTVYLRWLRTAPKKMCKPTSVRNAEERLKRVKDVLGWSFDLQALDNVWVQNFIDKRVADKVSPTTINTELTAFAAFLNFLHSEEKSLETLPVDIRELKFRKILKPKITIISVDEFKHLLHCASTMPTMYGAPMERTAVVLAIAYYTGLRHREITHLSRADVNFKTNELLVTAKPKWGWSPKTYEERGVQMHKPLRKRLEEYLGTIDNAPDAWLFPGYGGNCITGFMTEVRQVFQFAGLGARSRRPGLHSLRRTWATNLLEQGVSLGTVKQLGGWSSITSVERYVGSSADSQRRAIGTLPDVDTTDDAKPSAAPKAVSPANTLTQIERLKSLGHSTDEAIDILKALEA